MRRIFITSTLYGHAEKLFSPCAFSARPAGDAGRDQGDSGWRIKRETQENERRLCRLRRKLPEGQGYKKERVAVPRRIPCLLFSQALGGKGSALQSVRLGMMA
jgi:hypothetical protein